jgi:hypothetical protein
LTGRDAAGRFANGFSPDRGRGREAAPHPIAMAADLRTAVLEVANSPRMIRTFAGRRRTVSLFEASVLRIASGQTSRRTSVTDFVRLVLECAAYVEPEVEQAPPAITAVLLSAKQRVYEMADSGTEEALEDALAEYLRQLCLSS